MLKNLTPRLILVLTFFILAAGCSNKLSKSTYSVKIESEGTTGGSFIYRPIIIFADTRKIEDYSTRLAPQETTLKVAVQKEYSAAGVYIDEPITKIISQSPKGEITFVPEVGKNYRLFGTVIDKQAVLWIEDKSTEEVVAGEDPNE